jgi:hypothetical protein
VNPAVCKVNTLCLGPQRCLCQGGEDGVKYKLEVLNEQDIIVLHQSIEDMVKVTPSTSVAVIKFKKIMAKVGQNAASVFREILTDVLSETVKKMLWS